jgi:signal transduction histidine kinase
MQAIGARKGESSISLDSVELSDALIRAEPQLQELVAVHGKCVRLMMADNGLGVDEATLRRLFETFFATKAVNEGTGLGLALVHGIVKGHGRSSPWLAPLAKEQSLPFTFRQLTNYPRMYL